MADLRTVADAVASDLARWSKAFSEAAPGYAIAMGADADRLRAAIQQPRIVPHPTHIIDVVQDLVNALSLSIDWLPETHQPECGHIACVAWRKGIALLADLERE
jgi:hypothetical protein